MTGQPLDPVRPVLAAAQRAGEINPEQVGIIERALSRVDRPGFDPAAVQAGEELLTLFALQFGPKDTEPPHSPGQDPPSQPRRATPTQPAG